MSTEIASLFAKISADVSDFSKGMNQVRDDMTAQERGIAGLQSAIGTGLKVAAGVAVTAVAGLATGIGYAVTKAADMEQGIQNIAASMQLGSEETAELKDLIMDLGLDPKLKVTAVEAAQAIEVLGTAGLTMDEILQGAARSTVLLANSTGADFASAGAIATDVMAQFNIEAADMAGAVDQITGVTVASKFTIDDYRLALGQAGGVAGSVGVEFDDFNAVIAATSPSFDKGSDAGTSFKTFLQRLVPTTADAKEELIKLGLSTGEDVVTAFFDAQGAMRPMEEIAENLQTAFGGLSEAQKIEAASTIFGTDAMRTALALAEGGGEIIAEMKKIIGNTSAEESAATRMDSLRGSWEIMTGVAETLTLGIGDKFIPVVRSVVDWLTGLAQKYGPPVIDMFGVIAEKVEVATGWLSETVKTGTLFNDKFKEMPQPIQDVVKVVVAVTDAVKNFITSVGDTFRPIADLIAKYVTWQDVIAGTVIALTIMLAPAIGTIIVALGAFVTAVAAVAWPILAAIAVVATLRTAWEADFGGIQEKTRTVLTYITDTFGGLFTTIQTFGTDALQEIVDWATGNDTEFTAVKAIWESAKTSFGTAFDDMKQKVTDWIDVAWKAFKENFPEAAQALKDAWESISTKFNEMWAVIKPLIDTAVEKFGDLVEAWQTGGTDMGTALQTAKTVLDGVWKIMITAVETSIGTILDTIKLVGQLLSGDFKGAWETAKTMVNNTLDGLKTIIATAFDTILRVFGVNITDVTKWKDDTINILTGWKDSAVNNFITMKDSVISTVGDFIEKTRNNIETWRGNIVQKYTDLVGAVKDKMNAVKSAIMDPIEAATDSTKTTISGWRDSIGELIERLRGNVLASMAGIKANVIEPVKLFISDTQDKIDIWKTWIIERWQLIKEAAKEKWDAIYLAVIQPVQDFVRESGNKINEWKDWLVGKFGDIWTSIQNAFKTASEWVEWGRDLIQGLWDGIKGKWNSLTDWFSGVWNDLTDRFKRFFGISSPSTLFAGFGGDMMSGLQGGISSGVSGVTSAFDGLSTSIGSAMANITSTLTTQINSAMASVVEGVRYGAGLVNLATADVLAQSLAAEAQARAAWEATRAAAALAPFTNPIVPPAPGVPASALLGNNAPAPGAIWTPLPPMPGPVGNPIPTDIFEQMNTMQAVSDLFEGRSNWYGSDNAAVVSDIADFGTFWREQAQGTGITGGESVALQNVENASETNISALLNSMRSLIQALESRGLGNQINIDMAPSDLVDNREELRDVIAYIQALYAT